MKSKMDLSEYSNKELKKFLCALKQKTSGNKQELILRLQSCDQNELKTIIEQSGDASALDATVDGDDGEDTISKLRGDVAMLQSSVAVLVSQLQSVLSGANRAVSLPGAGEAQTNAAVPEALLLAGLDGVSSAAGSLPEAGSTVDRVQSVVTTPMISTTTHTTLPSVGNVGQSTGPSVGNVAQSTGPSVGNGAQTAILSVDNATPEQLPYVCRENEINVAHRPNSNPARCVTSSVVGNGSTSHVQFSNDFAPYVLNDDRGPVAMPLQDRNYQTSGSSRLSSGGQMDVRDMIRMMPEFHPSKGMSSTNFIERIDQLSSVYGWSEQAKLYAVYDQLKGPARQWVNAMPIFERWLDFTTAFLADFPSGVNTAEINMQMMRARMSRHETFIEYYYRMLALGRSGDMQDSAIITYIIHGLYDYTTKKILSAMHFPRCSDLLKALQNVHVENNQIQNNNTQLPKSIPSRAPQQKFIEVKPSQHGPICYKCRERGHIARNCRKAPKINCISKSEEDEIISQGEVPINNIAQNSTIKELRKTVTMMGKQHVMCTALMDSGSSKSLVRKSIAFKTGQEVLPCNERLLGFGGSERICDMKINVNIKLDDTVRSAELLIIDDDVLNYDILIGIDVLAKGVVVIENGVCHVMSINQAKVDVADDLPTAEVGRLEKLLSAYSHCFGEKLEELGKSKSFKVDISVTSQKPIVRKPYPIPIPKQQVVEDIVEQLVTLGIVRPSKSSYASPIVLVKKANGEHRLCVDFRELNAVTQKQPWQMPTVDGVLATLANKKYFTTLDMMSGYYQLELEESAKQFTAFVTHHGHFEFCRMPFGLRNAPCAFQRLMSELIAPLRKYVVSYVDEVIIATVSVDENLNILQKFLKLVENEGLTLRLSKCSFLKQRIAFLGHEVDGNGIRPGAKKTTAIKEFPMPKNQAEVRRFLGLAGFFRKFVPQFAMIARPLNELLRKDAQFVWTSNCNTAFEKLVQILSASPVLTVYDPNKEHQVHTDASSIGLAAIFLQQSDGDWKPVAFYSRACTDAESKYHGYELEVLAVVEACERFKMFLLGKQFTIVTDCQSIASIKIKTPTVPRVARWFLKLLEYDYKIVHRAGESMRHVDALSRAPVSNENGIEDVSETVMEISVEDWVATLQRQDAKLKDTVDILCGLKSSNQKKQISQEYRLKNHRLFRKQNDKLLLVIPKGMRWRIVRLCHDEAGHPRLDGTLKRLMHNFWFPKARNFVKNYIKSCVECGYHRVPHQKEGELYGMETPALPFQVLHTDHLGPFIKTRQGNEYVLVVVDALTRYCIITPVKSTKSKPVIDSLNQMTAFFGLPQTIVTDRGTAFTSATFEEFCAENDIKHIKVAVRTPRANGLAERVNQAVINFLKTATKEQRDWDRHIRMLQWTFNTNTNATTKKAPIELVYDFPLRDLSGNKILTALHDDVHIQMNRRRDEASNNIAKARQKWKKRFDAKFKKPLPYQENDLVLIESPPVATGESKKLQPRYKGPYVVKKVLRYDRYVVQDVEGVQRTSRPYHAVVAADKMKPWCTLLPEADSEDDDNSDED